MAMNPLERKFTVRSSGKYPSKWDVVDSWDSTNQDHGQYNSQQEAEQAASRMARSHIQDYADRLASSEVQRYLQSVKALPYDSPQRIKAFRVP